MAINKYFTDESLELFVDKIKEYTDNAISQNSNTCEHDELTNEQIDAILGPLDGGSGDDSGSGDSASSPDIELDGTLTQSGMAADAKVVGDRLATKANINHTHDFSISSIPSLQTVLDGKAALTHTHNVATTSANGFMSLADKFKLNNIESGANKTIVDSVLSSSSTNPIQNKVVSSVLAEKANTNHTHNYAGSTSSGGAANSANKLNTSAGSSIKPVYFANGVPVETTYTVEKSVPSDAVFTDTTYSVATSANDGLMSFEDKIKLDGITNDIDAALSGKVPNTRTINGISLSSDIVLSASNIGADVFGSANNALESAKSYADSVSSTAANTVKNDLLNGAGEAYDTLKELGDLISANVSAIDALEMIATDKANKVHAHAISDITDLQSILNGKSDSSHNHNDDYDEKGSANTALVNAKTYVDEAISDVNDILTSTVKTVNNIAPDSNGNVVVSVLDGEDGISPTITVSDIENGHRLTIADVNGSSNVDVINGVNGYTPIKGIDYWTEEDKAEMLQYMLDSLPNGNIVSY